MKLSPQEERVLGALKSYEWCDETILRAAINDPDGTPRWTPPKVVVSKLRRILASHGFTIQSSQPRGGNGRRGGSQCKYRLVAPQTAEAAAA